MTDLRVQAAAKLNEIAQSRGQSLAQMALAWLLKDQRLTSVIIGTSSVRQLHANLDTLQNLAFTPDELAAIDAITADPALQL